MRMLRPLILCLVVGQTTVAFAERRNPLDGQPAIRNKRELRKLRFEITPEFVTSINQDYRHAFGFGGNLEFHLTDWLGIGVQGSYTFNTNTALESKVEGQLPTGTYQTPGPQPTLSVHEQRVLGINALLGIYASITPFAGKFALFSAAFARYDLYLKGGLGMVNYIQNPSCCSYPIVIHPTSTDPKGTLGDPNTENAAQFTGLKVGGMFGVGVHDVDADRHLCSGQAGFPCNGNNDQSIQNNLFVGLGFVIMLPPKAKITH
jgi:hypothetical protein